MKLAKKDEKQEYRIRILRNTVCGKEVVRVGDVVIATPEDAKLLVGMGKAEEVDEKTPLKKNPKPTAPQGKEKGTAAPKKGASTDALDEDQKDLVDEKGVKR